ncbi:hypothetical protein [Deinococcus aerolatus]|uniref:hypothetical protein n=1 Tax=Deinococcus aerolatus TaxID=522487 RepID=UPI0016664DF8|nr:hypothetical protein [Deinococcus aerolatus]
MPASRLCTSHSELAEVRVHGDCLAATAALCCTWGFEAETDIRDLLVTGRGPER